MKSMKAHLKRWNFICSYTGITIVGAGIFALCFPIHLLFCQIQKEPITATVIRDYPACFLFATMPLLILMTASLAVCNTTLLKTTSF